MAKDVLVIVEHEEGKVRRGSLEALALARKIAEGTGGRPVAAILGSGVESLAQEVAGAGADEVFHYDDAALETYSPDAYRVPLNALVEELGAEWVLMGHTYLAQDLLPLVAAKFEAPVISDCVDMQVEGDNVVFSRQPYDAKLVARTVDRGPAPHFASLQSGAFSADDLPQGHGGTVTAKDPGLSPDALRRTVHEIRATGSKTVDLSAAEYIVAGGRGLGSKEKFEEHIGSLAKVLGASIGASRPVVDAEWLPHEHQIGSSGQVVTPKLYIAVGISGAIQHSVGIRGAQCIVSINKDKDAPIFNDSNYGLVGDAEEIVPALVKAIEEAKG